MSILQSWLLAASRTSLFALVGIAGACGVLLKIEGWDSLKARGMLETVVCAMGVGIARFLFWATQSLDLFAFVRRWVLKGKLKELDDFTNQRIAKLDQRLKEKQITAKQYRELCDRYHRHNFQIARDLEAQSRGQTNKTTEPESKSKPELESEPKPKKTAKKSVVSVQPAPDRGAEGIEL